MDDRQPVGQSRPSGVPRRPSNTAGPSSSAGPSVSRFGYRPPNGSSLLGGGASSSLPSAAPLGKRNVSSTSFQDDPVSSTAKRTAVRVGTAELAGSLATPPPSGPQSPSASQQLAILKNQYESRLLLSQQSYNSLEDDYRGLAAEAERLKGERKTLLEEWEQIKVTRAADAEAWKTDRQSWQQRETELRKSLLSKDEELQAVKETSSQERQDAQAQLVRLKSAVSRLEAEKSQAEEAARTAQEQCREETSRRQEEAKRAQQLEQRLQEIESQATNVGSETAIVNDELHRILSQSRRLEAEVMSLKSTNEVLKKQAEASAVLKEENSDLRRKVDAMDLLRQKAVEYEQQAHHKEAELQEWNSFLSSADASFPKIEAQAAMVASDRDEPIPAVPTAPSPLTRSTLPIYIAELRGTVSGLISRSRVLTEKVTNSASKVSELANDLERTEQSLRQADRDQAEWRSKEQAWIESKEEWQEELRRYRQLLKSYEQEQDSLHKPAPTVKGEGKDEDIGDSESQEKAPNTFIGRIPSAHLERIALLEQDLQTQRNELERTLQEHQAQLSIFEKEASSKDRQIEELQVQLHDLQSENDKLDEQLGRAEERLGRGEFDVDSYRCLVLKDNPVDRDRDLRKSTMDRLEKENDELKKRVQEIGLQLANVQSKAEEASPTDAAKTGDDTPVKEGWMPATVVETLREEVESLLVKVASREKAMLRQKESFGDLARIYRATIESLFGFKMQFHGNRLVEVHSILNKAVRPEHTRLLFKWKAPAKGHKGDGETLLCEDEGNQRTLARFSEHSAYWLSAERYRMPCFLGAMQMSVYEDVTMAVRSTWRIPDEGEEEGEE